MLISSKRSPGTGFVASPCPAAPYAGNVPLSDRRRAQRIRQEIRAEVSEWVGHRAGRSFRATIHDLSTTGVGIVGREPLSVGATYVLAVPRPSRPPLAAVFTATRSDATIGGRFATQLEPNDVLEVAIHASLLRSPVVRQGIRRGLLVAAALFCASVLVAGYFLYDLDAVLPTDAAPPSPAPASALLH